MATQSVTLGISAEQDTAIRAVESLYRLFSDHICFAMFEKQKHEIQSGFGYRLIDSLRLIGEMRSTPNTAYVVDDLMRIFTRAGSPRAEYQVRLTLKSLIASGFVETFSDGDRTRYRYRAGSVERATSRFNEEKAILCSPALKEGERIGGIEV